MFSLHMKKAALPLVIAVALGLPGTRCVRADVKLPAIFGDHMVLQQEAKLPVWGWADPGEKITVTFGAAKAGTTTGADGKWRVDLPPAPAGTPSGTLVVAGKNTLTINDVLVGEVWVCSGQSNMEFLLSASVNGGQEISHANDSQFRLFHVVNRYALNPCDDVKGGSWQICSPQALNKFTAVGYFFGKNLRAALNRPVGLIESAQGGSSACEWTSLSALESDPVLHHYTDTYESLAVNYPGGNTQFDAQAVADNAAMKKWLDTLKSDTVYQAALKAWPDASAKAKAGGQPQPPQPKSPV